jgi:hypothetical protein
MSAVLFDVALALPPFVVGLVLTWRVIWPRWKVYGKSVAYVVGVAVLSFFLGHWSVVLGWAHQAMGLAFHLWFCRRNGFTWYSVEDPDRYIALSKAWAGAKEDPGSTAG